MALIDSGAKLHVMWSVERITDSKTGDIRLEGVVHICDGTNTIVSIRATNVDELTANIHKGAGEAYDTAESYMLPGAEIPNGAIGSKKLVHIPKGVKKGLV